MAMQFLAGARVHLTEVDPSTGALAGNVGLHVGDDPVLVRARREAMARRLDPGRDRRACRPSADVGQCWNGSCSSRAGRMGSRRG